MTEVGGTTPPTPIVSTLTADDYREAHKARYGDPDDPRYLAYEAKAKRKSPPREEEAEALVDFEEDVAMLETEDAASTSKIDSEKNASSTAKSSSLHEEGEVFEVPITLGGLGALLKKRTHGDEPAKSHPLAKGPWRGDKRAKATPKLSERAAKPMTREPWMPSRSEIQDLTGASAPPCEVTLFSISGIKDDAEALSECLLAHEEKVDYYISLFYELRYYESKRVRPKSKVPEWQALTQGWNAFIENFNRDPAGYRARIEKARERHAIRSPSGRIIALHNRCVEEGIPCAVPYNEQCYACPRGASRLLESEVLGHAGFHIPQDILDIRVKLFPNIRASRETTSSTRYESSFQPSRVPSSDGARTPPRGPERPPSGRSEAPKCRVGENILSNDTENDADLGETAAPGALRFARQYSESSHRPYAKAAVVEGTRWTQRDVKTELVDLRARVSGLESFLRSEVAAIRFEMSTYRAETAHVSDTFECVWPVRKLEPRVPRSSVCRRRPAPTSS